MGWKIKKLLSEARRHKFIYFFGFLLPIVLSAVFVGYPILYNVFLSFFEWDGFNLKKFIGFDNYTMLSQDSSFWVSLSNNIKWVICGIIASNIFALLLAVLFNSKKLFGRTFFRNMFFLPVTMSLVSTGIMFSLILNPNFGLLDSLMKQFGLVDLNVNLLGNPPTAIYTLIAIFCWSFVGIPMMLFHTGISSISPELYESAKIEGANGFGEFYHITLPSLKPVFMIVTTLIVIQALKSFDLIAVMTNGGPGNATRVLGFYMYTSVFRNYKFGYGASISVIILILSSVFALVYLRKVGGESLHGTKET